ncbi:MAG: hypothetical protein R3B13_29525, partial [Polyangiaceae bacterium]
AASAVNTLLSTRLSDAAASERPNQDATSAAVTATQVAQVLLSGCSGSRYNCGNVLTSSRQAAKLASTTISK